MRALQIVGLLSLCSLGACVAGTSAAEWRFDSDRCLEVAGYAQFRAELEQVVRSRDAERLRALFHPEGEMRVNSVGGNRHVADWGFTRPEAQVVWKELESILELGCIPHERRLFLPAMAVMVEMGEMDETIIALHHLSVRERPDAGSRLVRIAEPGAKLTLLRHDGEWSHVQSKGIEGYVPTAAVRSPASYRLELGRHGQEWRMRSFSTGI